MKSRNIILVGFMGTGKSTVGRALAQHLKWTFIDTDQGIEQEAGMSIPTIFEQYGEHYFRDLESKVIARTVAGEHQVIATGGGAVLREENRKAMLSGGLVVALKADSATIISRVREDTNRPLLAGDLESKVQSLLKERERAYDFAQMVIDTSALSVSEIVQLIQARST